MVFSSVARHDSNRRHPRSFPANATCSKSSVLWHAVVVAIPFAIIGAPHAYGQADCRVFCDGNLHGIGTRDTAEECLVMCTGSDGSLGCECGALTDCTFDGLSIVPTPACGNGLHEGAEACDPGVDPFGDADCACTGQCQADCTCPNPAECRVFCDGNLHGIGTRDTAEECLVMCTGSDGKLGQPTESHQLRAIAAPVRSGGRT